MQRYTEGWCESSDGTEIFYSLAGPGEDPREPDIVLCDGVGCDGFVWKYLVPTLAARHRVIRYHYRGHGYSKTPLHMDRFRIEDLVDDLYSVLDHIGAIEPVILAGHSVGVQVILEAHRHRPERIGALVPTCGSYGRPLDTFHDGEFLKKMFPILYQLFTGFPEAMMRLWRALLPSSFAYWTALLAGEVNRSLIRLEDLQPYFEHLSRMDAQVFANALHYASTHSARDHLPRIDVPTLVIAAENDTFTPAWLSHEMADHIPNAELLMVPKGSHAAPIEQPDLILLRLEKFLAERLGCYLQDTWRQAHRGGKQASKAKANPAKERKKPASSPRAHSKKGKTSRPQKKRASGS